MGVWALRVRVPVIGEGGDGEALVVGGVDVAVAGEAEGDGVGLACEAGGGLLADTTQRLTRGWRDTSLWRRGQWRRRGRTGRRSRGNSTGWRWRTCMTHRVWEKPLLQLVI